jgi:hypothetical protein
MKPADDRGAALITVLLVMLLMGALAGALAITTTVETTIAGNYRRVEQDRAAAEAVLERALVDLAVAPDWTPALAGGAQSTFSDGPPTGVRTLLTGERVDLDQLASRANCRQSRPCTASELTRVTSTRPWGANNPVWRPYAYGPLRALDPALPATVPIYVVAMIGDDPAESDGDPQVDGGSPGKEGLGRVALRGYALGPRADLLAVEAVVERGAPNGLRIVSWTIQFPGE